MDECGGDTLQIEVNMMPGKGELELTGQLGRCDEGIRHDWPELYPFGCQRAVSDRSRRI